MISQAGAKNKAKTGKVPGTLIAVRTPIRPCVDHNSLEVGRGRFGGAGVGAYLFCGESARAQEAELQQVPLYRAGRSAESSDRARSGSPRTARPCAGFEVLSDHLPLARQSEIYARQGVELERSTMADWVGGSGEVPGTSVPSLPERSPAASSSCTVRIPSPSPVSSTC